jgi:dipeptidyl aminopeptidase/acylaminoacyl peptidase
MRASPPRVGRPIALALTALALAAAVIAASDARRELASDFHPHPHRLALPASPELATLHDVTFDAVGAHLHGWLLAPGNGAAIVLLHGAAADRATMLPEAAILARHGFAVLLYDGPGHGESTGRVTWDEEERAALRAALDRLAQEPGVDRRRLGVLGFSMGSIIAAQVAAGDDRVRGVALTGAIPDFKELLHHDFGRHGPLSEWSAQEAARWAGMDLEKQRPVDLIAAIAPRPVLLVTGSEDTTVPPALTRELFDAAREPKTFFVVPGGRHGRYAQAGGESYEARLVAFFVEALRAPP